MHALAGDLSLVSLPSLLQLVQGEALSGRLVLEGCGSIDFTRGQPVDARLGSLTGESALMELFVQEASRFHFDTTVTGSGKPMGDPMALLMDGCRLTDEWERTRGSGIALVDGADVPGELTAAVADLRAGYALEVVARRSGIPGGLLVECVLDMLEDGHARLIPAAEPPLELDYWGALELGQKAYRARDYPAAIRAFSRALACRPDDRIAGQNLRAARRRAQETP